MATEIHQIGVGDTLTPLGCQCAQRNTSGVLEVVNLTGLTVKFTMVSAAGAVIVNEATTGVAVTDAINGKVRYDFQSADVANAGTFFSWFTVYSGTEHDTYPVGRRKLVIEISARR